MSFFKRFGPGDEVDNVLILEPTWTVASGTGGWRGSPEGSASVSLYGGARRQVPGVIREYRFQRMIPGTDSFGPLARSGPITASVNFVYATNEDLSIAQRSANRWGYEHWKTLMGLYSYYKRRDPDFVTASYDYYCLFFQKDSRNIVDLFVGSQANYYEATGSFTLESWFNPFLTASATQDFTLQSYNSFFWFGLTGSTGRLTFSSSMGSFTASQGPTPGRWHHAAVSFNATTLTGTLYLDLNSVGTFSLPAAPPSGNLALDRLWTVGSQLSASDATAGETYSDVGAARRSFHGFIGESRMWGSARTWSQISGTHGRRLTAAESSGALAPVACLRLSDGPLCVFRYPSSLSIPTVAGSGALNHTTFGVYGRGFARLMSFSDRAGPTWHPSDNESFRPDKTFVRSSTSGTFEPGLTADQAASDAVTRLLVVSVPAGMYGRRITPGSVSITDRAFSDSSCGLVRTLVDDGRGGLYLSGSAVSASYGPAPDFDPVPESRSGVIWNKVGNVFYDEGLVVIKDPALLDFGASWTSATAHPADRLQLSFRGESRIPVKTLMCRIDRGELNASLNPSFWTEEEDGDRVRRHPSGSLYVTTVGLYNADRELVGVAKTAEPIRVRLRDRMNIRLRIDF